MKKKQNSSRATYRKVLFTQSEFNEVALIAENNYQDKLVDIKRKNLMKKRKLAQQEYNDRVSDEHPRTLPITQEDVAIKSYNQESRKLKKHFRLDQEKGEYSILTEQIRIKNLQRLTRI